MPGPLHVDACTFASAPHLHTESAELMWQWMHTSIHHPFPVCLMILLMCHAGFSKLPMFPPPQCGSSNPAHALIISLENLAGAKHSNYGFAPCSQRLVLDNCPHSWTLWKKGWILHFFVVLFSGFSFYLSLFHLIHPSALLRVFCLMLIWLTVLCHTCVCWGFLTNISWSQANVTTNKCLGSEPSCLLLLSIPWSSHNSCQ